LFFVKENIMKNHKFKKIFFLFVSILFLALGVYGNHQQKSRHKAPFKWSNENGRVVVAEIMSNSDYEKGALNRGDALVQMDEFTISKGQQLEFLFDIKKRRTNDTVSFIFQHEQEKYVAVINPVLRYKKQYVVLNMFLGLLFWLIGIFVYIKKMEEKAALVFAWTCISLAVMIMTIWPRYPYSLQSSEYFFSAIFFVVYPLVTALIFYFSVLYPQPKRIMKKFKSIHFAIFLPSVIFISLLETTYFLAIQTKSLDYFNAFTSVYYWFRVYYIFYLVLSIASMVLSYRAAVTKERRNKILWILWGLFFGAAPFLFLWSLPQVLGFSPLIPQEFNYILLTLTPLAFGFSIVKYQVLDIDVVFNRSIVYTILTAIIIGLYLLLVGITGKSLHGLSQGSGNLLIIVFTLFAAIIFSPVKQRVQIFVDKTFYRIKYDYGLAINEFGRSLVTANNEEELFFITIEKMNEAIPMKKIAAAIRENSTNLMTVVNSQGLTNKEKRSLAFEQSAEFIQILENKKSPMVKKGRADLSGIETLPSNSVLEETGIELVFPLITHEQLAGFLVLGQKKSEARYFEEDIQLLAQMIEEAMRALERIKLQETMILERAAKEKLEELNQLKSEFISHVSHELRTPLTSICWSVENMLDGIPEKPSPKMREYLEGVNDCSQHLQRMIENLLDITKIEAGKIEIFPTSLLLKTELQKSIDISRPLAKEKEITFELNLDSELIVRADKDSLRAILTNLLGNAVKYSKPGGKIKIKARLKTEGESFSSVNGAENFVVISVIDSGPGIPKDKQAAIFEKFERINNTADNHKGLGLGLHIVKKLVEVQGGRIWVESEEGKGSVFSFILPVEKVSENE